MANIVRFIKENETDWAEKIKKFIKIIREQNLYILSYKTKNLKDTFHECRGIILDSSFEIICRPFDLLPCVGVGDSGGGGGGGGGGGDKTDIECRKAFFVDKVDGSLIKIFKYSKRWSIATRTMGPKTSDKTFVRLVLEALNVHTLDEFNELFETSSLDPSYTYLFELTSARNRVLLEYDDTPKLHYLAARKSDESGEYFKGTPNFHPLRCINFPVKHTFGTLREAKNFLNERMDTSGKLLEGFVIYDAETYAPLAKLKTEKYIQSVRKDGKRRSEMAAENLMETHRKEIEDFFGRVEEAYANIINNYKTKVSRLVAAAEEGGGSETALHNIINDTRKELANAFPGCKAYALDRFNKKSDDDDDDGGGTSFLKSFYKKDPKYRMKFCRSYILK